MRRLTIAAAVGATLTAATTFIAFARLVDAGYQALTAEGPDEDDPNTYTII